MEHFMLLVGITLSALWCFSNAFPSGAPSGACGSMLPKHGVQPKKIGTAPYKVDLGNVKYYTPGTPIQVTISGMALQRFRGYLLQAKVADAADADDVNPVGHFRWFDTSVTKAVDCKSANSTAVTHTDNSDKLSATALWMPPETDVGDVVFWATIVRQKSVFWIRVKSWVLKHISNPKPGNGGKGGKNKKRKNKKKKKARNQTTLAPSSATTSSGGSGPNKGKATNKKKKRNKSRNKGKGK